MEMTDINDSVDNNINVVMQNPNSGTTAERISDDQKLFLKVLENLKNAVSKPDVTGPSINRKIYSSDNVWISVTPVSDKISKPKEVEEPGTTNVTVSDKTKSLIVQKLAVTSVKSSADNLAVNNNSHVIYQSASPTEKDGLSPAPSSINETSEEEKSSSPFPVALYSTRKISSINQANINTKTPVIKQEQPVQKQSSTVQLYPCSFCDYYSENKFYLKQHIDLVHISGRPFKCPYCEYAGKRSRALREHLIVHSDERPFQCPVCKATFRKKGHLTNHVKLHNSKRLVKCPLCKALVYDTGENGLDAHLKNDHDTERLYGCDLCEHIAANEPDIIKHLRQMHKKTIVSSKCDKCPYETANNVEFQAHKTAHELSNTKVEIGDQAATDVIGVATLSSEKDTVNFGAANTVVKMKNSDNNSKQPAVIKPVWIKCSECGFTGQDSEVIRKHMLEHLMDQNLGITNVSEVPTTSTGKTIHDALRTKPTGPSVSTKSPDTVTKQQTPILVPITNIDHLLPHHAGKIDMNSPILVPVTDVSMIKKLQQLPTTSVVSSVQLSLASSVSPSLIGKLSSAPMFITSPYPQQAMTASVTKTTMPVTSSFASGSTVKPTGINFETSLTSSMKKGPLIPSQLGTTKSVVSANKPSTTGLVSMATTNASSNIGHKPLPGSVIALSAPTVTASTEISSVATSLSPAFQLTQIPVPRLDIPTSPSKVSSEFAVIGELGQIRRVENSVNTSSINSGEKIMTINQGGHQMVANQERVTKVGSVPVVKLDEQSGKSSGRNVVIYVEPVKTREMPGKVISSPQFTHDTSAGRFKCTLCGYTCEHQRTIKAHIWKHSGNKDIDYPMFQNGPLSVYDDENLQIRDQSEGMVEVNHTDLSQGLGVGYNAEKIETSNSLQLTSSGGTKMPPFIVYEQTKISQVAPALAHLIAARTMVGMKRTDDGNDTVSGQLSDNVDNVEENDNSVDGKTYEVDGQNETQVDNVIAIEVDTDNVIETSSNTNTSMFEEDQISKNVVVETVNNVTSNEVFTCMQSRQGSPRISTRSPDSGVCELTSNAGKTVEDTDSTISSVTTSTKSKLEEPAAVTEEESGSGLKRNFSDSLQDTDIDPDTSQQAKRVKILQAHEDSAVTLLSLLKKGPNFNPACPPQTSTATVTSVMEYSNISSPGHDDSNSIEETEVSGIKPKSGISTSLLAVIEQLRERSKSDLEEEKSSIAPVLPVYTKKPSKRRSRKSSLEDNTPVSGIENVEEFDIDGETKFRCKLCHYTNESTVLLRQHMRLHKPKQDFQCSLCNIIAESSEALQDHMIQHCKVRTYQCKLCIAVFNYKSQLRAHMRMHNDHDLLLCDFCDFESRNLAAMKLHTKSHLTKPPYKCEGCFAEFITSNSFREHKREGCTANIDKNKTSFKCEECDFVFFGRREMKNHLRLHMGKNTTRLSKRCPYCDHLGPSIENIQKHIADIHGESKPLKCDMCGFFAVSIRSLKSHMKRHVNDQRFVAQPLEQYKCNLCGYVCHHLPSLKSHMWRHAPDQHYSYEFTNDVINAAIDFDGQTDVTETKQIHVDEFKFLIYEKMKAKGLEHTHGTLEESAVACCWVTFRCCQCGFETINKAELNMHMSAHSDVIKMTLEITDENAIVERQGEEIEAS
ncbi:hypothetical protein ACF0H5_006293 [Mactra antiquata]